MFDRTYELDGRLLELADFDLLREFSISICNGLCDSRDGREDAVDVGPLSNVV